MKQGMKKMTEWKMTQIRTQTSNINSARNDGKRDEMKEFYGEDDHTTWRVGNSKISEGRDAT